jgi:hypothetical protein
MRLPPRESGEVGGQRFQVALRRRIRASNPPGSALRNATCPPHAVAIFRLEGIADASQPVVTLLNRDNFSPVSLTGVGFNLPKGALLDGTRLWMADTSYSRVLGWNSMEEVLAGARASLILRAADTAAVGPNIGRSSLFMPGSLAWDGSCLWVGEFKFSSRLLRFSPRPVAVEQGRLKMEIHGVPGQEFSVQSSTNLLEWNSEGTGRIPSVGSMVSVSAMVDGASVGNFLHMRFWQRSPWA